MVNKKLGYWGVQKGGIIASLSFSRSKFNAILNVVRFLYSVILPALFQVFGRVWRGNLSKKVRLAGGTKYSLAFLRE